jgi:hypothetical protein
VTKNEQKVKAVFFLGGGTPEYLAILFLITFTELVSEVSSVGSRHDEEQEEAIPEVVMQQAAIKIQSAFRGMKVRLA